MRTNISLAFDKLTNELNDIIDKEFDTLYTKLQKTTPTDTFEMIKKWSKKKPSKWEWNIHNDADHSVIIARGRRKVNGKWYGSIQNGWAGGIDPMLAKFERTIERKAKNVQY